MRDRPSVLSLLVFRAAVMAQVDVLKVFVGGLRPDLKKWQFEEWLAENEQPTPLRVFMVWVLFPLRVPTNYINRQGGCVPFFADIVCLCVWIM